MTMSEPPKRKNPNSSPFCSSAPTSGVKHGDQACFGRVDDDQPAFLVELVGVAVHDIQRAIGIAPAGRAVAAR
jgi:hypothetical protein